jgi:hypothetical protein
MSSWGRPLPRQKPPTTLVITHSSGFFSCCTIRLTKIIEYCNKYGKLPDRVDSDKQFEWYKPDPARSVVDDYFQTLPTSIRVSFPIFFETFHQFTDFRKLPFASLRPFIERYFSLTEGIKTLVKTIESKYSIDYGNTCVLFYRGNDKATETTLSSYEDYIRRARVLLSTHPAVRFLIQSDETEFIDAISVLPNTVVFRDEIRHISKASTSVDLAMPATNYEFSKLFLAIVYLMSQCKWILMGSGNISLWITLYRGSCENIQQFLEGSWY